MTPVDSFTPMPSTSAAIGEISRQEKNQRSVFQNHTLPISDTRPPAEIGAVATRMISAASRTNMISR